MHESRLAGARRAHDGGERAADELDVDAAILRALVGPDLYAPLAAAGLRGLHDAEARPASVREQLAEVASLGEDTADALLGAAGLADIGALYPSENEAYRGADSLALLTGAYAQVRAAGYALVNADCVVIGQDPRVAPHREEMRRRLAAALGVEEGSCN